MKRGGFKRATVERRPVLVLPAARAGLYARADQAGQAHIKPEPCRPGKRAPTVEESRWMDAIVRYGCIACRLDGMAPRPTAVHHILRGGLRIGHLFTLPLCDTMDGGHHQNGASIGLVSRHPNKAAFEDRYGSEASLLELLRRELGFVSKEVLRDD